MKVTIIICSGKDVSSRIKSDMVQAARRHELASDQIHKRLTEKEMEKYAGKVQL